MSTQEKKQKIENKIKKEVIIYPDNYDTKKINCIITSKLNALGTLSGGLLGAVGRLELNIYPDPKEIIKNPRNYNFRNIKDVNNIVPYSTLHLKENHKNSTDKLGKYIEAFKKAFGDTLDLSCEFTHV